MGDETINNRDFLKSIAAACLLFALTLVGMAEMTGFHTTVMGLQVGGHWATRTHAEANAGASQTGQADPTQSQDANDPELGSTTAQEPVVTGIVGGSSSGDPASSNTIEISARVINAQMTYQAALAVGNTVPDAIGEFTLAQADSDTFTLFAPGIRGVAYVLEATFDLRQWQPVARNYPDADEVRFEVNRGSEIHSGFLRVRALTPMSAETMTVGALPGPTVDSGGGMEPPVTGVVGGAGP